MKATQRHHCVRLGTSLLLLWLIAAGMGNTCLAKRDNYKISLTIANNNDSFMLLGFYYAENIYVLDTAWRDKKGRFIFRSDHKELPAGMYFFANATQNKWVDFVIYHEEPFFTFETDEADWTNNMQVKGSQENELLFDYKRASSKLYQDHLDAMADADSATRTALQSTQQRQQAELKDRFIKEHPGCMLAKVMNATRDPYAGVPLVSAAGDTLSNAERYAYFMHHYFDNMPLDDDMLVRTPKEVFYQRVNDYFDRHLKGAAPETIIAYADTLIEKTRPSKEVFKWTVHFVKEKYLRSKYTVYEAVAVHIIQQYYAKGDAYWCAPGTLEEMTTMADKWERLLIGRTAPELILYDTSHTAHSLHHLPHRYKLLVFWSPTCGHCKTMIPQLYERYSTLRATYDIGAFAILSEPDEATRPKWHQFIAQHHLDWLNLDGGEANIDWHEVYDVVTTPQIYLLDENNVIMAKKLNADTFQKVVEALCTPMHGENANKD